MDISESETASRSVRPEDNVTWIGNALIVANVMIVSFGVVWYLGNVWIAGAEIEDHDYSE